MLDHLPADPSSYESPDGDILPFADVEELRPERVHSEAYHIAEDIIKEGIRKSKEGGYAELKVGLVVGDDNAPNGIRTDYITLAQFFGGNKLRRMVSKEEFRELEALYGHESTAYAQERAEKYAHIVGHPAVAFTAKPIESVVPKPKKPVAEKPVYESGHQRYWDPQSAAANDDTLKD